MELPEDRKGIFSQKLSEDQVKLAGQGDALPDTKCMPWADCSERKQQQKR